MAKPMALGSTMAAAAAVAFGVTTPFVQRLGRQTGPFATATLLYAGAAVVSVASLPRKGAPIKMRDVPRVLAAAILGAAVGPAALAWGLQRTSGVVASLLLSLEAPFTALIAAVLGRETLGPRALSASALMWLASSVLVLGAWTRSPSFGWGSLAVVAATIAWALDNVVGLP